MSGASNFSLEPAPRKKLAETVAEQLLEAIEDLPPGTRVPSERELTESLDVGRSTVREALKGLALLGVVEIRHGQGVFVAERPPAEGEPHPLTSALARGVTRDLLEARRIIEVEIARLAAERRTDEDLASFEEVLAEHAAALERGDQPVHEASQFHVVLARVCHNDVLEGVFASFFPLMIDRGPLLYSSVLEIGEWELREHTRIYEAIRDRDSALASARMLEHVMAMAEHYREAGEA